MTNASSNTVLSYARGASPLPSKSLRLPIIILAILEGLTLIPRFHFSGPDMIANFPLLKTVDWTSFASVHDLMESFLTQALFFIHDPLLFVAAIITLIRPGPRARLLIGALWFDLLLQVILASDRLTTNIMAAMGHYVGGYSTSEFGIPGLIFNDLYFLAAQSLLPLLLIRWLWHRQRPHPLLSESALAHCVAALLIIMSVRDVLEISSQTMWREHLSWVGPFDGQINWWMLAIRNSLYPLGNLMMILLALCCIIFFFKSRLGSRLALIVCWSYLTLRVTCTAAGYYSIVQEWASRSAADDTFLIIDMLGNLVFQATFPFGVIVLFSRLRRPAAELEGLILESPAP